MQCLSDFILSLLLFSHCCIDKDRMSFWFNLHLPPLHQGFLISFKTGQRIHIIPTDGDVKMYLAKTHLHKYYAIYYIQSLLCAEFSLAWICKSNLIGKMLAM